MPNVPSATGFGSLGPNGLPRLPGGNPDAPELCKAAARSGKCSNKFCSFRHPVSVVTMCRDTDGECGECDDPGRFFASRDENGLLAMDLSLVDAFLSWEGGRELLCMGMFPNSKEISESMACLQVALEQGLAPARDPNVLAVVIGDGRTPRTAALLAMRTQWQLVSIDPALQGLVREESTNSTPREDDSLPKELRNDRDLVDTAESAPARRRLAEALQHVERLEMRPCKVQDTEVEVASWCTHVLLLLPHAHVTPDAALRCVRYSPEAAAAVAASTAAAKLAPATTTPEAPTVDEPIAASRPRISMVQLPCCGYVWHDTA